MTVAQDGCIWFGPNGETLELGPKPGEFGLFVRGSLQPVMTLDAKDARDLGDTLVRWSTVRSSSGSETTTIVTDDYRRHLAATIVVLSHLHAETPIDILILRERLLKKYVGLTTPFEAWCGAPFWMFINTLKQSGLVHLDNGKLLRTDSGVDFLAEVTPIVGDLLKELA